MTEKGGHGVEQEDRLARLARLLEFLEADPGNATLACECAEAAMAAGQPDRAVAILGRLEQAGALDEAGENLAGIAAMQAGDQAAAQARFERLLASSPDDPALRFNLAWSRALARDPEAARETLDAHTIDSLPQAAMLDLQLLHRLGEFEQAREKLAEYLERHGDYAPLQATASVLAMDLGEVELARACAERGGEHPEALATLGALDLAHNRYDQARQKFEKSLAFRNDNPRAHIGLGLADLSTGRNHAALEHLDLGAAQFGDHLGSWIAAGWAHSLAGDPRAARERFETALGLDDTFAETHGSLAVLDALAGDVDSAKRRMAVALRLDRQSYSAALAGMLLASAAGDGEKANKIFGEIANRPLTVDGKTLLQALAESAL